MSITELALILFVALILFGPEDLLVIAKTLGRIVREVRKYTDEISKEFQDTFDNASDIIFEDSNEKKSADVNDKDEKLAEPSTNVVSCQKETQAGE